VLFFSTAIVLYGYDQGMISMMGISEESPVVGIIVSVYYLGCALGAVFPSWLADRYGRKRSIPLPRYSLYRECDNILGGLGYTRGALVVTFLGRITIRPENYI